MASPEPCALDRSDRTRGDGLAGPPTIQILREGPSGGIATAGILLEAFEADGLEIAIQCWIQGSRSWRHDFAHGLHDLEPGRPSKRKAAGQEFVEYHAKAEEVRGRGQVVDA